VPSTRVEYALIEASLLPVDIVNAVIGRIGRLPPNPDREDVLDIVNCVSQSHGGRAALRLLLDAWWEERESVPPASLCLALRASTNAAAFVRQSQTCELAWSGPELPNSLFRRTDRASADVIDRAQSTLWLATYSISKTDLMIDRLSEARRRGVQVHLLVEYPERLGDGRDFTVPYRKIGISPMTWRADLRPKDVRAAFHPKCIVADSQFAFVTSANLSLAAHDRNIETGVLISGGELPRQLAERFASLLTHGMLEEV
jgi:cardiolipin synthase